MNAKTAGKMALALTKRHNKSAAIELDCMAHARRQPNLSTNYHFWISGVLSTHVNTWAEVVALYDKYMEDST